MDIEIGDSFIITYDYGCEFPNKEFIVESFSKSLLSVYFYDKRTNNSCKCRICRPLFSTTLKCAAILNIKITKKRLQKEREVKLKKLLKC